MTEVDHLPRLSPGAQRMRRYRRRREAGQQCITLTLHEYQLWALVACGFLDKGSPARSRGGWRRAACLSDRIGDASH